MHVLRCGVFQIHAHSSEARVANARTEPGAEDDVRAWLTPAEAASVDCRVCLAWIRERAAGPHRDYVSELAWRWIAEAIR